jgi:hypothetical protein
LQDLEAVLFKLEIKTSLKKDKGTNILNNEKDIKWYLERGGKYVVCLDDCDRWHHFADLLSDAT